MYILKSLVEVAASRLISAAVFRYNKNAWKNKAYADYMITASLKEGINEMHYGNLVVMCSEVVPWRCHRRMVADQVLSVITIYLKYCVPM